MFILDESSPVAEQPTRCYVTLKWHQLTMIRAMLNAESAAEIVYQANLSGMNEDTCTIVKPCNVGILADKVGAGKTLTLLGLICSKLIPEQKPIPYQEGIIIDPKPPVKANLIIVPHNIFNQWAGFLDKTNLKVLRLPNKDSLDCFFDVDYVYELRKRNYNSKHLKTLKAKAEALEYFREQNITVPAKAFIYRENYVNSERSAAIFNDYDVILLSNTIYRSFNRVSRETKWARVICDEAEKFKGGFYEYASFYWLVTATPSWDVAKLAHCNLSSKYITYRNDDDFVDKQMTVADPKVFVINTGMDAASKIVSDLVSPDILKMINAGNIKGAAIQLNCGIDTKDNILKAFTNSLRRQVTLITNELEFLEKQSQLGIDCAAKIKRMTAELEIVNGKINDVKQRLASIDSEICFICADEYDNPTITKCCKHVFCFVCLTTAISKTNKCPYCSREPKFRLISDTTVKPKQVDENQFISLEKGKAFVALMNKMYETNPKARILIFSEQMDHCYDICKTNDIKYKYAKFKGSRVYLNNALKKYEAGEINLLLIDPQNYGSGSNIQFTDYVVLMHRLSKASEIQGIGRAQRYGRTSTLKIIYMINERESKIIPYPNPTYIETIDEVAKI